MSNKIDKKHNEKRAFLRTMGIIVLVIGLGFLMVGMVNFFSAFSNPFGGGPRLFWCNFVGIPLLFIGIVMISAGYMGAVARYEAEEIAPVGKDVFNYMANETSEGVETIAKSIHNGITNGNKTLRCTKCNELNDSDAKYCNNCGYELKSTIVCDKCGKENEATAKFCNSCGSKLL